MSETDTVAPPNGNRFGVIGLVLAIGALACGDAKGTVTIRGDAPGLDSMGRVGDQLASQVGAAPPSLDSLRAEFEAQLSAGGKAGSPESTATGKKQVTALPAPSMSASTDVGDIMTKRAQARGDSMAKAAAARFSGGLNPNGTARGDTVRGLLEFIGTGAARQLVLRTKGSATTVTLSGMATNGLSQLAGTEIMVRGLRTSPRDIVVLSYVVRAVAGVPAWDGVLLQQTSGQWTLRLTEGGFKRLGSVPDVLKIRPGARVWISIKKGGTKPESFGAITAR